MILLYVIKLQLFVVGLEQQMIAYVKPNQVLKLGMNMSLFIKNILMK